MQRPMERRTEFIECFHEYCTYTVKFQNRCAKTNWETHLYRNHTKAHPLKSKKLYCGLIISALELKKNYS